MATAVAAGIVLVVLTGIFMTEPFLTAPPPTQAQTDPLALEDPAATTTILTDSFPADLPLSPDVIPAVLPDEADPAMGIMVTDGIRHTIPLDEIKSGGPPKDGIPSIDNPVFAGVQDASFVADSDTVIGLEINGQARAYPLSILVWHEIVNDEVGGTPVAVTYCPLCYTMQVFERVIDGQTVEFGTTGKLYNSNLLMYDRLTDSYWSQAIGTAVVGQLSGHVLDTVSFDIISWGDWKGLYPDTMVLTTDTGHARAYGVDLYDSYYTDRRVIFPIEHRDDRLHPKEIILGFNINGVSKAYPQGIVESETLVNDAIGDTPILLVSLFSGNARAFDRTASSQVLDFEYSDSRITDTASGSVWNYDGMAVSGPLQGQQLSRLPIEPGFWFEWAAFHPQTLLHGDDT